MDEQNWGIVPCDTPIDISPVNGFTKLSLSAAQKIHVEALIQQLPSAAAAGITSKLYTVTFPDGVAGKLMELKRGGFTTSIIGEDGKIVGSAALHSLTPQAMEAYGFLPIPTQQKPSPT